uniref:Leucine rich adaptor protein 1-like n=2 Tax=Cynoglossus semilaevis TaxID=244447 RepID=A0A3P8WT73_CYNSE
MEENHNVLLPELKEMENKVGMKTPEILLSWMGGEDANFEDVNDWRCHTSDFSGDFSDRISSLKHELRLLRSADVKILRQLVAVHEGIEALRWLIEEQGATVSLGSSLSGSLSSLVTVVEQASTGSTLGSGSSPTFPKYLTETPGEDSAGQLSAKFDYHDYATDMPSPSFQMSQPQNADPLLPRDVNTTAGTITRALLRSRKSRKEKKDTSVTHTNSTDSPNNYKTKEEERIPNREDALLVYDTQWCWMESKDDVTYL